MTSLACGAATSSKSLSANLRAIASASSLLFLLFCSLFFCRVLHSEHAHGSPRPLPPPLPLSHAVPLTLSPSNSLSHSPSFPRSLFSLSLFLSLSLSLSLSISLSFFYLSLPGGGAARTCSQAQAEFSPKASRTAFRLVQGTAPKSCFPSSASRHLSRTTIRRRSRLLLAMRLRSLRASGRARRTGGSGRTYDPD